MYDQFSTLPRQVPMMGETADKLGPASVAVGSSIGAPPVEAMLELVPGFWAPAEFVALEPAPTIPLPFGSLSAPPLFDPPPAVRLVRLSPPHAVHGISTAAKASAVQVSKALRIRLMP